MSLSGGLHTQPNSTIKAGFVFVQDDNFKLPGLSLADWGDETDRLFQTLFGPRFLVQPASLLNFPLEFGPVACDAHTVL